MSPSSIGGFFMLILLAILAPTPIPVPLDAIVIGLIAKGFNPTLVITTTLIGDLLGTYLIFLIGTKSRDFLDKYKKNKDKINYVVAGKLFNKFGKFALLFAGIPFVGDALIFISGFYKMNLSDFLFYFIAGKLLWYLLLSSIVLELFHHKIR